MSEARFFVLVHNSLLVNRGINKPPELDTPILELASHSGPSQLIHFIWKSQVIYTHVLLQDK